MSDTLVRNYTDQPSSELAHALSMLIKRGRKSSSETLWEGGIIEEKIPTTLSRVYLSDIDTTVLRYTKRIGNDSEEKAGLVNFYIHASDPTLYRGKTIVAKATIRHTIFPHSFHRYFQDKYLMVDLEPVENTKPTHMLWCVSEEPKDITGYHPAPPPLLGAGGIIVKPILDYQRFRHTQLSNRFTVIHNKQRR